ncbi:TIR domain-containing protein [Crateriforma conspicua]|uniref:Putative nucleotide-binding protein containing TIR-like domain protein n=1 Tax=Crateriforma conspicua TaxID=2527996 RepID=A0A5C5YH85_9PLAN|nr:nucleotide-binding protein [Crateriforma conspicua]TWT72662.1 putative nucleotide-binding protein containing TIR-like domain protein [Crateriforma conspicua]
MARKKVKSDEPVRTTLTVSVTDAEQQLRERVATGHDLLNPLPNSDQSLDAARERYYTWTEYNGTLLERLFNTDELSQEYSYWGIAVAGPSSLHERISDFTDDVNKKIRRIESIIERLPLYAPQGTDSTPRPIPVPMSNANDNPPKTRDVFVVHGRNNELKETVARFLSQLDLQPIILHEQASAGRTIIEKFEDHSGACYAVILLTPDDVGGLDPPESIEQLRKRARQNVIFEWGFFVANLGRRNVCALVAEGVEIPSDMDGIVYVPLDRDGAWKMLLARELKAGNVDVDLNRAIT